MASCLLVILLHAIACGAATPSNYFMRVWQTDDGLPENGVNAIVQTGDGYLWIGTFSGLVRFDGVRFAIFDIKNSPAMLSDRVTSLFEDDSGNLWIGYETGGLTRYHNGMFQSTETPAWKGRKILAIGEDRARDIWALGVDGSLLRLRDSLIIESQTGAESELGSFVKDRYGKTWVLWNGKISLLEGDHLEAAPFHPGYATGYVQGMGRGRDGGLWIASDGRLHEWKETDWGKDLGMAAWGIDATMSSLVEMSGGGLVAGVVDHGLCLVRPYNTVLYFNRTNGLPSDWVRCLCEDREGNLWIGSGNGLVEFRPNNIAIVDSPDHWQGRAVLTITEAHDGALWIGTEGAGLYRMKQAEWRHFDAAQGILNSFVWSASEDAQGQLWAGTWGGGLFVQRGDHFEHAPGFEEVTAPVLALLHIADGSTWVGTRNGLAHCDHGKVQWYGSNEGLIHPDVRAVVQDRQGAVWFGMLGGGLGVIENGRVRQFRKVNGLSSDFVQCLRLDNDGSLWIGTSGGGLNRLKKGQFAAISISQGLPNDVICDIEDDEHGNFWFSSHGGIFRVSKNLLNACADGLTNSVHCIVYGKGDGLPTLECSGGFQPAGCRTADGRLWFPTSKGLVAVDTSEPKLNQLPPPVIIEDLLINGRPVERGTLEASAVRIPPGQNRFEIHYTGLSLVAPEKVKFKYRLDGLDREWVSAGMNRFASYSYVPPGHYTFHVIACNNDDIWNETGRTLAIIVLPHFWQTWWFRLLIGLCMVAAGGAGVLVEMRRRMRRKLARIESQRAVERERVRIARDIHDDLGASLTRITMLSQPARMEQDHSKTVSDMDRIYHAASDLTHKLDEIVWAVNPKHDTLDSLATYLGTFAQDFLEAAHIRCRLDIPIRLPPRPLTAETRHNLFLAFKEALNNAVKHAGSVEIRISLLIEPGGFSLQIEDKGRGFLIETVGSTQSPNSGRQTSGHGLQNMRQRLAQIGGRCDIHSVPGEGTTVRLVVPNQSLHP
jgi:signal transduction histidine kinase/ligand-binding sensor domain-containing protein